MFVLVELPKYLSFIKVQMYLSFLYSTNPFMSSLSSSGSQGRLFCGERAGDSDLRFSGFLIATRCSGLFVGIFLGIGAIESLSNPEQIADCLFCTCWRTRD